MALTVHSVTFDAADPAGLAQFWAQVFEAGDPLLPDPSVAIVQPVDGPQLMFIKVDDPPKTAKNRCHLDLHVEDRAGVDAHTTRLVAAGAKVVGTYEEHGVYWTSLTDPEGNELDVGTPVEGH